MELSELYDTLGMSVEDALSSGDIQSVYHRVFHTPVSQQDTLRAVRKVTGDDEGTTCHAGKIFDILLEIDKDRVLKEELYWNTQMRNAGMLCGMYPDISAIPTMPFSYKQLQDQSQKKMQFQGGKTENQRGDRSLYVWRLKKDVRRICSRLSSEGLQHVIPSVYHGAKSTGPAGPHGLRELWSPCADLLQQIDDKYDIIRQKLCTEMLQDHYGNLSWEALLPWQQKERVEDLAAEAECSLDSADLLRLSDLPGAFRLYRSLDRPVLRLCPEQVNPKVLEWTAVLSLKELHSYHQLEKRGLAALMKGMIKSNISQLAEKHRIVQPLTANLDGTSLRRLSLYVQLMVMRAESEKHSHGALLAASQSWESWPDVRGPHCRDLAKFWLGEQSPLDSDRRTVTFSHCSPLVKPVPSQQAVLQYMLLCQEGERECLIKLLHSFIPEELKGSEEQSSHSTGIFPECPASMRKPCIVRLREMKGALRGAVSWGDCALGLLIHLMKLQEAEAWEVIQDLQKASKDWLITLQEKYAGELCSLKLVNLIQLLLPDLYQQSRPRNSDNTESSASEESITQLHLLPNVQVSEAQVYSTEKPQETRSNVEGEQERPAFGSERRELCSACGHTLAPEEIPYLEVLRATSNQEVPHEVSRANEKGEDGPCDVAIHFEKQDSLIAVAWGKLAEDYNNQAVSDALVEHEAGPSVEQEEVSDNLHLPKAPEGEEPSDSTFFQSSLFAARHQDQPDPEDPVAGKASVVDEGHLTQKLHCEKRDPQRLTDNDAESVFSECSQHPGDICGQPTEGAIYTGRSSPSGPTTHEARAAYDIDKDDSGQTMDGSSKGSYPDTMTDSIFDECSGKPEHFQERPMTGAASAGKIGSKGFHREATIVHLSEMEREETMKSLVDIQRKVESRCQRDKERQMFRIQERLSIVQNRKSDEDLLGHRQGDSLKELTENFKQEDRHRQKTLVKEKLEQLRRERSHIMQSKRDRNTSAFKELLDPVVLNRARPEDSIHF